MENRGELAEILAPAFSKMEAEEILAQLRVLGVPSGRIRNMKEVFEQKVAQEMILKEVGEDGEETQRVRTVVFSID